MGLESRNGANDVHRRDALKLGAAGAVLLGAGAAASANAAQAERASSFGVYKGYSEPKYDGWVRTSQYVPVRDGVRLAVDVFRPTIGGRVETAPLPVVWTAKRYLRATILPSGGLTDMLTPAPPPGVQAASDQGGTPRRLIAHGYVLASADMRGTGASFGNWSECSDPASTNDCFDIMEWFAAQPWCNGKCGMIGASYEGRMQLNAAASGSPRLKAIMPEVSPYDWYDIVHEGGAYSKGFQGIETIFRACDVNTPIAPVDDDPKRILVAEASKIHDQGNDYSATSGRLRFRDSKNAHGVAQWIERSGEAIVPHIAASGVATYHTSGFFARVGLDQLLWFSNLARSSSGKRHRIWMGPWPQGGVQGTGGAATQTWTTEAHRFFDYWLKDIDNGIMDEPPVVYSVQNSTLDRTGNTWRTADSWPIEGARTEDFFLHPGSGDGNGVSVNDGRLAAGQGAPKKEGADALTIDYKLAPPQGDHSPFSSKAGPGKPFNEWDAHTLTYTTAPLEKDLEVVGHPVLRLHVSSSGPDADITVHIEDVDPAGVSTFVTRRAIRVSHRHTEDPPGYWFDLPWHPHTEATVAPIPSGKTVEVALDFMPTAYRFRAGHRIRLNVAGSDADYILSAGIDPPKSISVHHGGAHQSRLSLPVASSST